MPTQGKRRSGGGHEHKDGVWPRHSSSPTKGYVLGRAGGCLTPSWEAGRGTATTCSICPFLWCKFSPWLMSSYQCEVAELEAGKRCAHRWLIT